MNKLELINKEECQLISGFELKNEDREWYEDLVNVDDNTFFYYQGKAYMLSDFMYIDSNSPFYGLGYHGYSPDSFFSGVLVKHENYDDHVTAVTYIG